LKYKIIRLYKLFQMAGKSFINELLKWNKIFN